MTQPPAETAAQRYARDVSQMRGDWQNDEDGDLVYVAPSATGGRIDREFLKRGGDHDYHYDEDGVATEVYHANGRNERIYVNYETGDSAVSGAGEFAHFDELKENS
jgi:hypothetical protein